MSDKLMEMCIRDRCGMEHIRRLTAKGKNREFVLRRILYIVSHLTRSGNHTAAVFPISCTKAAGKKRQFFTNSLLQSARRYDTIIKLERHLYLSGGQKEHGYRYQILSRRTHASARGFPKGGQGQRGLTYRTGQNRKRSGAKCGSFPQRVLQIQGRHPPVL